MAQVTNNFEGGISGNTILTTDTGSGTAWDEVAPTTLTDGTRAYDNAHIAHGSLAGKIAAATTDKTIYVGWTTSLGTISSHYGRIYLYITAAPAAQITLVRFLRPSTGTVTAISIGAGSSAKKIIVGDAAGTKATGAVSVATGQWVRIEWQIVNNTSTGGVQASLYNTADSVTADELIPSGAFPNTYNTGADCNEARFGNTGGAALTSAFWMDDIVAGATSAVGPVVGPSGPHGFVPIITRQAPIRSRL